VFGGIHKVSAEAPDGQYRNVEEYQQFGEYGDGDEEET
jgi:hypothetical protein